MEKKSKISLIVTVAAVLLTVAAVVAINATKNTENTGDPGKGGARGWRGAGNTIFTVRSVEAVKKTLNDYVITNGEVESQSAVEVFPSMGGKVQQINVLLGSQVKKGDVIAKIDPSEPGTKYALSPVEAPISGSIVSTPLKVGTKVTTNSAVTMIGDIDNLQISASVPERYVSELKTGLKAEITVEAYPDVIFMATVSRVSPVVDAATRTKQVIMNFDKKDSRVNAGMFAKVKLYTSKYSGKLVVPSDAIITNDDDVSYLFVVNDDYTVSRRTVKTGKAIDGMIQVTDNLMAGERVVYEGMLSLSDGANVNDLAKPKPAGDKK
ncbi:MAG: efflux RND transporter periplasmic adaptor subunit [Treponema sp.]|nr:efflux RND transporter periplasmic adaptor subunit [Treponema sp.]